MTRRLETRGPRRQFGGDKQPVSPRRAGVPVLMFHAVEIGRSPLSFAPAMLDQGLRQFLDAGWRAVSLVELVDGVEAHVEHGAGSFAVTFDDGYRSVYENAFPTLVELQVPSTVFLSLGSNSAATRERLPGQFGRECLSWQEIREMQRHGVAFGAHGITHADLTRLDTERLVSEVRDSQSLLESALGVPVRHFAYPFGRWDRRSRDVVAEYFDAAFAVRHQLIQAVDDRWTLPRIEMYYFRRASQFSRLVQGRLLSLLTMQKLMRRVRRLGRRG